MMRRTALAALVMLAVLGVSGVHAQTIGFKLGASFADWNFEDDGQDFDTDRLSAFVGGGFIRFGIGRLALQPEVLAVTRGTDFNDDFGLGGKWRLDYIEVPVLLMLPLSTGAGISPYLFGGPSFAFEIGCQRDDVLGSDESVDCEDLDPLDTLRRKSTDIGATAGLGLELPLGPGALLLEGRYNWGLSNLSDAENIDVTSRTAALLAGFAIPLGDRL